MKLKHVVAMAAALASSSAFAGATGNVGAVSEYMFRGVSQGANAAAIQGGLDYAGDSGVYAGIWGSNIDWGVGGSEVDVYGGFSGAITENLKFDLGAVFYYYPECEEELCGGTDFDPNTIEIYGGLIAGPITGKVYYSPKYFGAEDGSGDDVDNIYALLSGAFPLSDSVTFNAGIGYTASGEEIWPDGLDGSGNLQLKDNYFDYSIGVSKVFEESWTATFSIVGTDLEGAESDSPKYLIGVKKVFEL